MRVISGGGVYCCLLTSWSSLNAHCIRCLAFCYCLTLLWAVVPHQNWKLLLFIFIHCVCFVQAHSGCPLLSDNEGRRLLSVSLLSFHIVHQRCSSHQIRFSNGRNPSVNRDLLAYRINMFSSHYLASNCGVGDRKWWRGSSVVGVVQLTSPGVFKNFGLTKVLNKKVKYYKSYCKYCLISFCSCLFCIVWNCLKITHETWWTVSECLVKRNEVSCLPLLS